MTTSKDNCPICDSEDISILIETTDVPINCNRLYLTFEDAIKSSRGNLRLAFCYCCGHLFNTRFDPELTEYAPGYENALHFSPRFQEYAELLAHTLVQRYNLYEKQIIEIGCGNGFFLNMLCSLGNNRGIGFDPSFNSDLANDTAGYNFTVIQDYYSEKYSNYKADLICCRHVLEHIKFPKDLLATVHQANDHGDATAMFFEVPNLMFTLKGLGIWDLIYEHCHYFSKKSLARLFSSCGFQIVELYEKFEGQFLGIEVETAQNHSSTGDDFLTSTFSMNNYVTTFAEKYKNKVSYWKHHLEDMKRENNRAAIWGGGSKGTTFLNVLGISDQIRYVIDINPRKHGSYVACTGQRIMPPTFLKELRPDTILVMNPIYLKEIERTTSELGVNARLISV